MGMQSALSMVAEVSILRSEKGVAVIPPFCIVVKRMTGPLRQEVITTAHMLVVKVGSRVLTRADGSLDVERIKTLAAELAALVTSGRRVVLVSSGAVAAGMDRLGLKSRPKDLAKLQAVAAVGQSFLVEVYDGALRQHGRHAAQLLLTADDLDERSRYLNVRNTILTLFEYGAIPILNENDTVSVEELQISFGDNDRLAAIVTNLIRAPLLVLLSDVEGLYDGNPDDAAAKLVPLVTELNETTMALAQDRESQFSKGGMISKLKAARIATKSGENVIIASGRRVGVLAEILAGDEVGTLILAEGESVTSRKRWIGFAARLCGHLVLDPGAGKAVGQEGRSLLAVGIVRVVGDFKKGDVVGLKDGDGRELGRGLTNYHAEEIRKICGMKTGQIRAVLGHRPYDEVIHRDNLLVSR